MTPTVRLLPEARVEFNEATDWHERRGPGLGAAFVARIRDVLDRIAADPERRPAVHGDVSKALVPKFPYVVVYLMGLDEVLVVSVFHTSRDPSAWKSRT